MEKYVPSNLGSSSPDDIIEVTIFDEPNRKLRDGRPDILEHPRHYRTWLTPAQAQVQVVCHQTVLDKIQQHAKFYARQEIGGILVGHYYRTDDAQTGPTSYVEIHDYLPAPREGHGQSSASHITFTETIWADLLREKDGNPTFNQMEIVGWFHSHPNWGTQPSSLDIDIQLEHFRYEWQVALIYDPQRHEGDFYLWDNDSLVRAPGFHEVFSRIRPEPVTNWRNYIALTQALKAERMAREAKRKEIERGERTGDATDESDASIPTATVAERLDSAQISISRDDIWKNFLRKRWPDILIAFAVAVLLSMAAYFLSVEFFGTPGATDDATTQTDPEVSPDESVLIPPYPESFGIDGINRDLQITLDGERVEDPLGKALTVYQDNTVCLQDERLRYALRNSANFMLQLQTTAVSDGYARNRALLEPSEISQATGEICFDNISQTMLSTRWIAHLIVYMPDSEVLTDGGPQIFEFEPPLQIQVVNTNISINNE